MMFRVPASVEIVEPESREAWLAARRPNIGASQAGGLLGIHSYYTPYDLYARKSGLTEESTEQTPEMERGLDLEEVALNRVRRANPSWDVTSNPMPGGAMFVDRAARLSSTPDAFVVTPDRAGYGALQIKTVYPDVFRQQWLDPDTKDVSPPLWVATQAILDAHFSGASWALVGALVGFNLRLHIIEVPVHAGVVARVREAAADFWRRIEVGSPPDPDYSRDGELLARLYAEDNGEAVDLSGDNHLPELVDDYQRLGAEVAAAEKRRAAIKAEILAKLGSAAVGTLSDGRRITAKTIRRAAYQVAPSSYRSIRITASMAAATALEGA